MNAIADDIAAERRLIGAKQLRYSLNFAQLYHQWYNQILLELLGSDATASVLDCGCGTGILLPALRQRYRTAVGLDLCVDNLLQAGSANGARPLVVGDVRRLPLAPQSFDHAVCRGVLHRLPNVGPAFQQIFAALKNGGDLVIAEPIADSRALNLLRQAAHAAGTHPFPTRQLRLVSSSQWIEAARLAGFRTVQWFHLGYLAFPLLGFPEAIPLMRYAPYRMRLAKILLHVDRMLASAPYLRTWSWQAVFHFRKPPAS